MKKESVIRLVKKHYLLLALTLVGILLLGWAVITKSLQPMLSTPIASIEPSDSSIAVLASSKLETYLEELKPDPRYRAAREEVMAMDFSKPYHTPKVHMKPIQAERPDSLERKTAQLPQVENKPAGIPKKLFTKSFTRSRDKDTLEKLPPVADGFHTMKAETDTIEAAATDHQLVKAVIEGDQKLKAGATLRLRLTQQATWKKETFPRNTIFHGTIGSSSNGRLKIRIVRIGETPLSLSVYDQDLEEGILYQMQEPVNEALKESSTEALNEVFYAMPYGGVAGGIARLGRNLFGKISTGRKGHIYLADGYEVFIGMSQ